MKTSSLLDRKVQVPLTTWDLVLLTTWGCFLYFLIHYKYNFLVYILNCVWFLKAFLQIDIDINPHLPSEYINYLENPMKILKGAERAAETDIWTLMQFTENLRRHHGKEPYSMEILLKKLYVRRMAADLGISRIYASGKAVCMETNMNKKVFKLISDSMTSEVHRNCLSYGEHQIKVSL